MNTVRKQTERTDTGSFSYCKSFYSSHHTNLYKTEDLLQQDQRKRVSPAELQETAAFSSSQSTVVCLFCDLTQVNTVFTGKVKLCLEQWNQRRTFSDLRVEMLHK